MLFCGLIPKAFHSSVFPKHQMLQVLCIMDRPSRIHGYTYAYMSIQCTCTCTCARSVMHNEDGMQIC